MNDNRHFITMVGGAVLALAAVSLVHAQAPTAPMKDSFVSADTLAKSEAKTYGTGPTYSYQTIIRDPATKYDIEVHDTRNDVILIQEGHGTAEMGGTVTGNHVTTPNEHRGGTMSGTHIQALAPGDLLFIPAGQPHLLTASKDSPRLRYLVVKTQP